MQRRRAELQLQALSADMSTTGADGARLEPAQDDLAPLRPATFLLARAREAANEVRLLFLLGRICSCLGTRP